MSSSRLLAHNSGSNRSPLAACGIARSLWLQRVCCLRGNAALDSRAPLPAQQACQLLQVRCRPGPWLGPSLPLLGASHNRARRAGSCRQATRWGAGVASCQGPGLSREPQAHWPAFTACMFVPALCHAHAGALVYPAAAAHAAAAARALARRASRHSPRRATRRRANRARVAAAARRKRGGDDSCQQQASAFVSVRHGHSLVLTIE